MLEALKNRIAQRLRQNANAMTAGMHEMTFRAKSFRQFKSYRQIDSVHAGAKWLLVTAHKT